MRQAKGLLGAEQLQTSHTIKKLFAKAPSIPGSTAVPSSPAAPGVKSCELHMVKAQRAPTLPAATISPSSQTPIREVDADVLVCLS